MAAGSRFAVIATGGRDSSTKRAVSLVGPMTLLEVWPKRRISPTPPFRSRIYLEVCKNEISYYEHYYYYYYYYY
jgi:hypothetical protein